MSEVVDLVMPMLQKINATVLKAERELDDLKKEIAVMSNKLDSVEHWVVHALGVATMAKTESTQALTIANAAMKKVK